MRRLVIAIDGPVGSGKSAVARRAADMLGYTYVDSGAMYRAVALASLRQGFSFDSEEQVEALTARTRVELRTAADGTTVLLDGEDVTQAIRSEEVSQGASRIALLPGVRRLLVAQQQRMGREGGIIMEGRDIGSVVFPNAELKIFLTASAEVRARRRWREYQRKNKAADFVALVREVRERDERDSHRVVSPLVLCNDAVLIDSSAMEEEEVARLVTLLARERFTTDGE
jgi:cytidylate kinase